MFKLKGEFFQNAEIFKQAIKLITLKRTSCSFIKSIDDEKAYELVPVEKKFDKFGSWEIDPLFNHMKIFLIQPNEIPFPNLWRTDKAQVKILLIYT